MFNPPPAGLNGREPLIHTIARGELWSRSHRIFHPPLYFGATKAQRWDSPTGAFGVLYLASDAFGAFMESIGRGVLRTRFVPGAQLRERGLSLVRAHRELRLIDMVTSGGLTRLGAEGSLVSGAGYKNSQRWSQALWAHPAKPDGIYYYSRHDPARIVCALFDRCAKHVKIAAAAGSWAEQPALLAEILDHYGLGTDL